jgi:hypothetical protein
VIWPGNRGVNAMQESSSAYTLAARGATQTPIADGDRDAIIRLTAGH